jgi:hypothetical protein
VSTANSYSFRKTTLGVFTAEGSLIEHSTRRSFLREKCRKWVLST